MRKSDERKNYCKTTATTTNTMGAFVCTGWRMTVEAIKLAAQYPSVCNASSSGWPLGLCTNAWPRNRSSRCLPAAPNRSPRSEVKHRGLLHACTEGFFFFLTTTWMKYRCGSSWLCTYLPLAHSLGWWLSFLVWGPAKMDMKRSKRRCNEIDRMKINTKMNRQKLALYLLFCKVYMHYLGIFLFILTLNVFQCCLYNYNRYYL